MTSTEEALTGKKIDPVCSVVEESLAVTEGCMRPAFKRYIVANDCVYDGVMIAQVLTFDSTQNSHFLITATLQPLILIDSARIVSALDCTHS